MFQDQRRTKPLRIIVDMLANPFTRSLGEWSNERKRSLSENPDVGFAGGTFHRFLIRNSCSKVPEYVLKTASGPRAVIWR